MNRRRQQQFIAFQPLVGSTLQPKDHGHTRSNLWIELKSLTFWRICTRRLGRSTAANILASAVFQQFRLLTGLAIGSGLCVWRTGCMVAVFARCVVLGLAAVVRTALSRWATGRVQNVRYHEWRACVACWWGPILALVASRRGWIWSFHLLKVVHTITSKWLLDSGTHCVL